MALTQVDGGLLSPTNAQYTAFKNRIINGAMQIDQRNAGASISVSTTPAYMVDRFNAYAATGSGHTAQRSTTAPTGFTNSILFTVGTGASPAAANINRLTQTIEGFNIADLGWGTANAQTVTLSFWVRTSVTGTHSGSVVNSAANRSYAFTFTVNVANTWEQKSVTIAGDTTGTWLTDNGIGINLRFNLGSGTDYLQAAGSWGTLNAMGATGSVSLISTTGATFYITGVQLEKGSTATSFDYRPYGTELSLCQRYYQTSKPTLAISAEGVTNALLVSTISYPVQMRSTPTISQSGVFGYELPFGSRSTQSTVGITFDAPTANNVGGSFTLGNFSSLTYSRTYRPDSNTNLILLSAEL